MSSDAAGWVTSATLDCPGIVRTVRLEPLETRHAPDLFAVADQELFRHSMQAPPEWSAHGFELEMEKIKAIVGVVAFAIVLTDEGARASAARGVAVPEGRVIGRTTYMDIKPEHLGLEIGRTWIGRAWHGTRVNPEIKYLMLRHAFEKLAPPAIRAQITVNGPNLHSQAAVTKLGAVREGTLRKARIMPPALDRKEPAIRDWVIYSIVDDEWPEVKSRLQSRLAAMA
jgi:RimJ/RimL family protein N-acetyltransferase